MTIGEIGWWIEAVLALARERDDARQKDERKGG